MHALEARHLADLTFAEVSRALRSLSSAYVERRGRLREGAALDGRGKRAAFALFYGPLHYLVMRELIRALPGATSLAPTLVDLGCGTGASGAAWALAADGGRRPRVIGIDRHPWTLAEAADTYRAFGLTARVERADAASVRLKSPCAVLAAFTLNEMGSDARDALLHRLLDRRTAGDCMLVVEPIARSVTPWWARWHDSVVSAGGRADEWRFPVELPALAARLDRAAGMDHRELTARSLWLSDVRSDAIK